MLLLARGHARLRGRVHSYPQQLVLALECSARGATGPAGYVQIELADQPMHCVLRQGTYTTTLAEHGTLAALVDHAIWIATGKKPYIRTSMLKADYK